MGLNKAVDFSTAKLLKEKGFDTPTRKYFRYDGKECENNLINWNEDVGFFSRPTIDEVKWWLYEKHGIWISVDKDDNVFIYWVRIGGSGISSNSFNSPTEAYEAAIDYTLNNLI